MERSQRRGRRHPRTPVEVEIRVSTIDPEIDRVTGRRYFREAEETCATLSPGGAFIRSLDPPAPGRRVLVQIHLPAGEEPIETTGRVAWAKRSLEPGAGNAADAGAGLAFDIDPEAEEALARYLARRAGPPPRDD